MLKPTFELEAIQSGSDYVIGVDEVGRGAVAGPVLACACVLKAKFLKSEDTRIKFVRDSKTLSEKKREETAPYIYEECEAFAMGEVSPELIDSVNIHNASLNAMEIAVKEVLNKLEKRINKRLKITVLVDGKFLIKDLDVKSCDVKQIAIVDGDAKCLSIAAASILAKTRRDQMLRELDKTLPDYGFAKHKGYGTKEHFAAIIKHGATSFHRQTFLKV